MLQAWGSTQAEPSSFLPKNSKAISKFPIWHDPVSWARRWFNMQLFFLCLGGPVLQSVLRRSLVVALSLIVLLSGFAPSASAAPKATIPPKYATWLNEEVPYIITESERSTFLQLKTDKEREDFIQEFWSVRNPDPNAPTNAFRDEHYRRIAYANDHFGTPGRHDGWRTDRGMVYITLGPPQQTTPYRQSLYLTPLEIWFYQSPSDVHALPPYFSVIFYQRSLNEDYKLYSPFLDRPERLVQSSNAVNDEKAAIKIIRQDLGEEVARLSISLLPNEPVDLDNQTPSLESDLILNRIRNFRNLPENKQLLEERRALHESVSHRVILGEQFSDLSVMASRDGESLASVSYLLQLFHPADFSIGQLADGRYYYSMNVEAALESQSGEVIYRDMQDLQKYLSEAEVNERKTKRLAVEGRLPAAPGSYKLRLTVTNKITGQAFTQVRPVVIAPFDAELGMSQLMLLSLHRPGSDATNSAPFTYSGIRLEPIGGENVHVTPGQPVRLLYQVWDRAAAERTGQIYATYTLGQLGRQDKQQTEQQLDRQGLDRSGSMLVGKDLVTDGLAPGPYRLVVRLEDPVTHVTTSQAMQLRLESGTDPELWVVSVPSFHGGNDPLDAFRRGQCARNQHSLSLAVYYFRRALAAGYSAQEGYTALAAAYREAGNPGAADEAQARAVAQTGAHP